MKLAVPTFTKDDSFGEVIISSSNSCTAAIWDTKDIQIANLILIESQDPALGIITDYFIENIDPSRKIIPLQLTQKEIYSRYPHLKNTFLKYAKIEILGQFNDSAFLRHTSSTPSIHAFCKKIEYEDAKIEFSEIINFLDSQAFSIETREKIIFLVCKNLFTNKKQMTNELKSHYFLLERILNKDLFRINSFFHELEKITFK